MGLLYGPNVVHVTQQSQGVERNTMRCAKPVASIIRSLSPALLRIPDAKGALIPLKVLSHGHRAAPYRIVSGPTHRRFHTKSGAVRHRAVRRHAVPRRIRCERTFYAGCPTPVQELRKFHAAVVVVVDDDDDDDDVVRARISSASELACPRSFGTSQGRPSLGQTYLVRRRPNLERRHCR